MYLPTQICQPTIRHQFIIFIFRCFCLCLHSQLQFRRRYVGGNEMFVLHGRINQLFIQCFRLYTRSSLLFTLNRLWWLSVFPRNCFSSTSYFIGETGTGGVQPQCWGIQDHERGTSSCEVLEGRQGLPCIHGHLLIPGFYFSLFKAFL